MFKFELGEQVNISTSGESGEVKGRAEYKSESNKYWVDCKANDDSGANVWFDEEDLQAL